MKVHHAVDGGAYVGAITQVAYDVVGLSARSLDPRGHLPQLRLGARRENDGRTLTCEQPRRGSTDAASGPGDEGDLVGQQAAGRGRRGGLLGGVDVVGVHVVERAWRRSGDPGTSSTWLAWPAGAHLERGQRRAGRLLAEQA